MRWPLLCATPGCLALEGHEARAFSTRAYPERIPGAGIVIAAVCAVAAAAVTAELACGVHCAQWQVSSVNSIPAS